MFQDLSWVLTVICYRLLHYEEHRVTLLLGQGLFSKILLDSSTFQIRKSIQGNHGCTQVFGRRTKQLQLR